MYHSPAPPTDPKQKKGAPSVDQNLFVSSTKQQNTRCSTMMAIKQLRRSQWDNGKPQECTECPCSQDGLTFAFLFIQFHRFHRRQRLDAICSDDECVVCDHCYTMNPLLSTNPTPSRDIICWDPFHPAEGASFSVLKLLFSAKGLRQNHFSFWCIGNHDWIPTQKVHTLLHHCKSLVEVFGINQSEERISMGFLWWIIGIDNEQHRFRAPWSNV